VSAKVANPGRRSGGPEEQEGVSQKACQAQKTKASTPHQKGDGKEITGKAGCRETNESSGCPSGDHIGVASEPARSRPDLRAAIKLNFRL
jgi:hypothetical protein